jgi:photosystem II stability/assembly factor-like uncharacterized protein
MIDRRQWLAGALAASAAPGVARAQADGIELIASGVTEELRGLSLAGEARWASGTKGMVLVGGAKRGARGADALDFRGLHAFSDLSALAMSAGPGEASQLWRTENGGWAWSRVTANSDPDGFWDAIAFVDNRRGFILGDPTQGRFTLLRTEDGGATWARAPAGAIPPVAPGEAAFAASNGSLAIGPKGRVAFCTGGAAQWARAYISTDDGKSFAVMDTPIPAGAETRGGFACAYDNSGALWVCGGDYKAPTAEGVSLARLPSGAKAFEAVTTPAGYLSSVAATRGVVIATGLAGTIVSVGGAPFKRISEAPFNTVRLKSAKEAALVGPKGALGVWRG